MTIKNLSIADAWIYFPTVYSDQRGKFFEWFQNSLFFEKNQENFNLVQANCSVSKRGVLRGIHFTNKAPGQSKIITVFSGKVFDVLVDLRKNSPTFGKWESITLDSNTPTSIYIPWGVGHGFMSLDDNCVFAYLCDKKYDPINEHDLNAFDPEIGIKWPVGIDVIQSQKDKQAPFLSSILDILPG